MGVGQNEEMMRRVEHLLTSCYLTLVLWYAIHHQREGGGKMIEVGVRRLRLDGFLPLVPWSECMLPQGWAGPSYNTEHNQRAGPENFLSPSLSLSTSLSSSSPSRAPSQTREHQHVYLQCTNIHTVRHLCVKTQTNDSSNC